MLEGDILLQFHEASVLQNDRRMTQRSLYPHFMKPYDRNRPERRRDVRVPLDAPIWLRILNSESDASAPHIEGRIMNISKRGMKLRLPSALEPGMSVQARMGGKIIMAEVRYCLAHNAEYHVGIEIQDVFPIPGAGVSE